jgi:hypothetical protein
MNKFFNNLTQINIASKFYRMFAVLCLFCTLGVVLFAFFFTNSRITAERESIYILDENGNIYWANKGRVQENRPLEAKAHVNLYLLYFFEIDKFTYRERINKALDLGTTAIYDLYIKLDKEGWYKDIEQYNVKQFIISSVVECNSTVAPYVVDAKFSLQISSDVSTPEIYAIDLLFEVKERMERMDSNPHALEITKLTVNRWEEVTK